MGPFTQQCFQPKTGNVSCDFLFVYTTTVFWGLHASIEWESMKMMMSCAVCDYGGCQVDFFLFCYVNIALGQDFSHSFNCIWKRHWRKHWLTWTSRAAFLVVDFGVLTVNDTPHFCFSDDTFLPKTKTKLTSTSTIIFTFTFRIIGDFMLWWLTPL